MNPMCKPGSSSALTSNPARGERRGLWRAPLLFLLGGCSGLEQAAPVVSASPGHSSAELAAGRRIYTQQCTACHVAEPVSDYSRAEWAKILPDMAERTKLRADQIAALESYVLAVIQNQAKTARSHGAQDGEG